MTTIELDTGMPDMASLLSLIKQTDGVVLTQAGEPVAQFLPIQNNPRHRMTPLHPGDYIVSEDFDRPLPEAFLTGSDETPV